MRRIMNVLGQINLELKKASDKGRAKNLSRFFKTGKGEYGEDDVFLGIVVPRQREIAKKYINGISIEEILDLLKSKFHEARMTALLILVSKYKKGTEAERKKIFSSYLKNTNFINNWDLVDVTCRDIVGAYLFERDKSILYELARSKNLWDRRISIISTAYFISKGNLSETFKIAKMLLGDKHDLIHKAAGWMLREAGKRDESKLLKFIDENHSKMPRTTLRYAIEKLPEKLRVKIMKR